MPITRSAKKKIRRDRRVVVVNTKVRRRYKEAVSMMRQHPSTDHLRHAASELDRASKRRIIHPNKARRLKSRLARLIA